MPLVYIKHLLIIDGISLIYMEERRLYVPVEQNPVPSNRVTTIQLQRETGIFRTSASALTEEKNWLDGNM